MGVLCLCSCKQRHYTSVPSRETIVQAKQKQRGSSCDCTCCCDQEQVGGTAPNDIVIMAIPDTITSQSSSSMRPKQEETCPNNPRTIYPLFSFKFSKTQEIRLLHCANSRKEYVMAKVYQHGRAMLDPSAHITTLPCSLLFSISLSHSGLSPAARLLQEMAPIQKRHPGLYAATCFLCRNRSILHGAIRVNTTSCYTCRPGYQTSPCSTV